MTWTHTSGLPLLQMSPACTLLQVDGLVRDAAEQGACVAAGGGPACEARLQGGHFYHPTVLTGKRHMLLGCTDTPHYLAATCCCS